MILGSRMPNSSVIRRFTHNFEKCFPFYQEKITCSIVGMGWGVLRKMGYLQFYPEEGSSLFTHREHLGT